MMKRNILLFVVGLAFTFCGTSLAQKRPLVKKNPVTIVRVNNYDEDGWQKFQSVEGKFTVLLPFQPERTVTDLATPIGVKKIITYTAKSAKESLVIGFLDYKTPINDAKTLGLLYDGWENGVRNVLPGLRTSLKDTTFDGRLAREMVYESENAKVIARVFFSGGKFFQMAVFNFDKLNEIIYKNPDNLFNNKFFDSVRIDKPIVQNANTDFYGTVENGVYRNTYFKFSLTLPKGWKVAERQDSDLIINNDSGNNKNLKKNAKQSLEDSKQRTKILFTATKNEIGAVENAVFLAGAEINTTPKADLIDIALATENNFKKNLGYTISKSMRPVKLGNVDFMVIEMQQQTVYGTILKQKLYMAKSRGYLLEFLLSYTDDRDVKFFEDSVKSLAFIK